jgi:hypothetical protein
VRAVPRIEISCRLVGEQQLGIVRERARDCHPLLFAARELRRIVMRAGAQADFLDERLRPRLCRGAPHDFHWHEDVLVGRERWNEVERLEDEADFRAAQVCEVVLLHARGVLAVDEDVPRRRIEPGDEREQRGLAAAGRADDRHELAAWDLEVHSVQDRQLLGAAGYDL